MPSPGHLAVARLPFLSSPAVDVGFGLAAAGFFDAGFFLDAGLALGLGLGLAFGFGLALGLAAGLAPAPRARRFALPLIPL